MEKYGFVYIWYDRKHKRYYIGAHWGYETDGYVCSSPWMKQAYKHRPQDFKRKILKRIYTNRKDTFIAEEKYLDLIKKEEFGKRYYNLKNIKGHWSSNEEAKLSIGQKISQSHKNDPNWGSWSIGRKLSDQTKQKLRDANKKQFENEDQRELRRVKSKQLWDDPEYRKTNTDNKKGKPQSEEQIQKRIISCKKRWEVTPKLGKPKTEEEKRKTSEIIKNMIWINDGNINRRINKYNQIPDGFVKGRKKN